MSVSLGKEIENNISKLALRSGFNKSTVVRYCFIHGYEKATQILLEKRAELLNESEMSLFKTGTV